jgi:hypothetical protein
LHAYTQKLLAMPGVVKVKGLTSIDPTNWDWPTTSCSTSFPSSFRWHRKRWPLCQGRHHRDVRRILAAPSSEEARQVVRQIRAIPLAAGIAGTGWRFSGLPPGLPAIAQAIWVPWTIAAIVCVIFVLLFFMLGSVFIPLEGGHYQPACRCPPPSARWSGCSRMATFPNG